ncbi:MAG: OsmC family protein [Crocinitomicaceae bacterium]|nr:OsmC family protein [Crocinitomicaceae bacterium]
MKLLLERHNDKLAFVTTNESGLTTITDASEKVGGENLGFRPMELLATSLASCASIDILLILEKQRQKLDDFKVEVLGRRGDEIPSKFEEIELKFHFYGEIDQKKAENSVKLTLDKYCSVAAMIENNSTLKHSVKIN